MIMQGRNMVVLDLIAVGRLFMSILFITFMLTGCSEKSKQDINILIGKFSYADETIIKFETSIATKNLSGFVSTGNDVVKLQGRINDSKELENIIDVSKGLANHLAPSMNSVVFRLDSEDKPMPIYFTVYLLSAVVRYCRTELRFCGQAAASSNGTSVWIPPPSEPAPPLPTAP